MLDKKRTGGIVFPYLRNANVQWGRIDTSDLLEMPFKPGYEIERYSLRARAAQPEAVSRGDSRGGRGGPARPDRGRVGSRQGPHVRAGVRALAAHPRRAPAPLGGDGVGKATGSRQSAER